jgi:PAS domain S-box-containing protein
MSKVNILVVDDRPEGVLAVQAVLTNPLYNIVTASSGMDALKWLLQDDFAVILMDVQMPIMNGFETAAVIKTREKSKDIPIIFMSAINQDEQYVYQGYGVGAVDYLLKPFDPYILRSKVSIFVDLYIKNIVIREQTKKIYEAEIKTYTQALDRLELESLRRFQSLADSIPQIVLRLNIDGTSEYVNRTWEEYTGLNLEMCKGLGWKDVFLPDDVSKLLEVMTSGKSQPLECQLVNKTGERRWHQVQLKAETHSETDLVNSWLLTAMDIQTRKRAEEHQRFLAEAGALLVSSLDYEDTVQTIARLSVPQLADWCSFDICIDGELKNLALLHSNPKKLPLIQKLYSEYMNHPDADYGIRKVILTGETVMYQNITPSFLKSLAIGDEQIKLVSEINDRSALVVPLIVKGETIGAITLVFSDSGRSYDDDLKLVAEELGQRAALAYENSRLYKLAKEAIELRNDFLSIASHELNTPITSLKLQLQLTKKVLVSSPNGFSPDKFKRSIDSSVKQVDRLISLVQVLLDVSRIQSGKFTFNFERTNLATVVNEVVERQAEILNNSNCNIHIEMDKDISVVIDKVRIEQVMINLLTNIIKYAPGRIDLRVSQNDKEIVMEFKDQGEGIAPDKLKKIFDRFERATSDASVGGLGLGLYIVKQIVEGHHGIIQVSSKEKEGTSFRIQIPKDVIVSAREH